MVPLSFATSHASALRQLLIGIDRIFSKFYVAGLLKEDVRSALIATKCFSDYLFVRTLF
jgi:hypothetical protein